MQEISPFFNKLVLVCVNNRTEKSSCAHFGSEAFADALKQQVREAGLPIKVIKTSCLGACHQGISMVIMPSNKWFTNTREGDIPRILEILRSTEQPSQTAVKTFENRIDEIFDELEITTPKKNCKNCNC